MTDNRIVDWLVQEGSREGGGIALMVAPPGSGCIAAVRQAAGHLLDPDPDPEVVAVRLAAGLPAGFAGFRAPHHTASALGLCGRFEVRRNGTIPGEISLAHRGVLLLDDLPEFHVSAIDRLWWVLRVGTAEFRHQGQTYGLPAKPKLVVATARHCGCGLPAERCRCTPEQRERYGFRIRRAMEGSGRHMTILLDTPAGPICTETVYPPAKGVGHVPT
jgi:magnesium chelatase family protein